MYQYWYIYNGPISADDIDQPIYQSGPIEQCWILNTGILTVNCTYINHTVFDSGNITVIVKLQLSPVWLISILEPLVSLSNSLMKLASKSGEVRHAVSENKHFSTAGSVHESHVFSNYSRLNKEHKANWCPFFVFSIKLPNHMKSSKWILSLMSLHLLRKLEIILTHT